MPARGHATAPKFDPEQPHMLEQFFQDLETQFERCGVEEDQSRKQWVMQYMLIDVADLCETLATYKIGPSEDFRTKIKLLFPGAEDKHKYAVADIKALVTRHAASLIATITKLSSYYREFFTITSIQDLLWDGVQLRLQIKHADHYPNDLYPMNNVYEAVKFVLHGTLVTLAVSKQPEKMSVKTEDLGPLLKLLNQAIRQCNGSSRGDFTGRGDCQYCSDSTGRGQSGGPLAPVSVNITTTNQALRNNGTCHYCGDTNCRIPNCKHIKEDIKAGRITRNVEGRIILPNGSYIPLMELRQKCMQFDGVEIPVRRGWPNPTAESAPASCNKGVNKQPPQVTKERPRGATLVPGIIHLLAPIPKDPNGPEHPFQEARDGIRPPPPTKDVTHTAPSAPAKESNKEVVYHNQVPVYQCKIMDTLMVSLTPEELLSISPEVRNKFRDTITPKHIPTKPCTVTYTVIKDANKRTCSAELLEPGGVVVPDPFAVYLKQFDQGATGQTPVVASELHVLCSIIGLFNNQAFVEAIVDPRCQIVTMSRKVCHTLGLAYDPTVRIDMLSGNGESDKSDGLICNVPFHVGNIQLYLQIHVVKGADTIFCLVDPFNILTCSVVKNYANEEQTVTIACPNSGEVATMPTIMCTYV
ncbi:hypothetical protein FOMPIDRAFT_1033102 [Fomitopsis schrenkii]|uniref:Uncharacterized protein n=1 Tax=Fomitopsis schrenkii TaxID=2126942 RepID=S8DUX3_FOMSC|nr:hypothetical protein FOMPIDRAFT_1033102 [Fomitopsis schrenkii]